MTTTPFCGRAGHPAPASLEECLTLIVDPRVDRTRLHNLGDILIISICRMLCGGESSHDMEDFGLAKETWFRTFPERPNGIPSRDAFNRVFAAPDPAKLNACFLRWAEGLRKVVAADIVSPDGEALRRATDGAGIPFIANAWSPANGPVLGQVKVDGESNEITAVQELPDALLLKGCIVTLDAMGCQKRTAAKIIGNGADCAIALKGSQGAMPDEVGTSLEDGGRPRPGPARPFRNRRERPRPYTSLPSERPLGLVRRQSRMGRPRKRNQGRRHGRTALLRLLAARRR